MTSIFETDRLLLRRFELTDAAFIIRLLNTKEWIQFIGDRKVKTEEDAYQYLSNGPLKSYEIHGFGLSLVALKDTGTAIGMCGLIKRETLEDIDIGYALLPEFAGKGYAYEIVSGTLRYAKKVLRLKRMLAITTNDNTRSVNLLKKAGMEFEKIIQYEGEALMLFGISL